MRPEKTGMTSYRYHSPNKLSGGQKQRVAIAGVMAMRPKCIILDEPTAMLDPNGRKEVLEAVSDLNRREGVTVILMRPLYGRSCSCGQGICYGQRRSGDAGTPRDFLTGGNSERIQTGCATGNTSGTRTS